MIIQQGDVLQISPRFSSVQFLTRLLILIITSHLVSHLAFRTLPAHYIWILHCLSSQYVYWFSCPTRHGRLRCVPRPVTWQQCPSSEPRAIGFQKENVYQNYVAHPKYFPSPMIFSVQIISQVPKNAAVSMTTTQALSVKYGTVQLHGAEPFLRSCNLSAGQEITLTFLNKSSTGVFTRARRWALSWTIWIQSTCSHPSSIRSILILSSHLHHGF
jgi:hypothetical protein